MDLTSYLLGKEAGGGGGTPTLQSKDVEITENGQTTVTADSGYDGLSSVAVTTNVQGGGDLSEYFNDTITSSVTSGKDTLNNLVKKLPDVIYVDNSVTSLVSTFYGLKLNELPKLIFGANITIMSDTFSSCSNISSIDTSGFNTSNVTNFYNLFYNDPILENIDVSNINVSSGTDFRYMFGYCKNIKSLNTSSWVSQNAQKTSSMFSGCSLLTSIDLSGFTTPNLTSTSSMFSGCRQLQHIDIRNMTFNSVTDYSSMFSNVPSNCEIIVKDDTQKTWITSKFSNLTNVKTVAEL